MRSEKIKVYGKLRTQGRDYWLIHPLPVELDSWQRDNERCYYVVPMINQLNQTDEEGFKGTQCYFGKKGYIYPYPRHLVVSGDYALEYLNDIEINVIADKKMTTQKIRNEHDKIKSEERSVNLYV